MEQQTGIQFLAIMSTFIIHVINIPIAVSSGIRFYAINKEADKAEIAENIGQLRKLAGVSNQYIIYKPNEIATNTVW